MCHILRSTRWLMWIQSGAFLQMGKDWWWHLVDDQGIWWLLVLTTLGKDSVSDSYSTDIQKDVVLRKTPKNLVLPDGLKISDNIIIINIQLSCKHFDNIYKCTKSAKADKFFIYLFFKTTFRRVTSISLRINWRTQSSESIVSTFSFRTWIIASSLSNDASF